MDIVERLRGLFSNSYGQDEIERAIDILEDAADEIERLRGIINDDRLEGAADEIERLRKDKAELLAALKDMNGAGYAIVSIYRAAIAKATGGER